MKFCHAQFLGRYPFFAVMSLVVLSVIGCNVLRMDDAVQVRYNDWIMYGGNEQRTHAATGEVQPPLMQVWEYDVDAGFGSGSVTIAESLIFVGNLQGELHVVRIGSGKRVGSVDLGSAIVGAPIVGGEMIYVPLTRNGENLVAFNLLRGAPDWRARIGDIETSPLLIDHRLYVTTMQGELLCVNQGEGATVWTFAISSIGKRKAIRSSPASDGNTIFFGADDGRFYAVRREDGKLVWSFAARGSIFSTPSIWNDKVYFGSTDRTFYCLDAASGSLIWKQDVGSPFYGSPAVDQSHVFAAAADGRVFCFDAVSGEIRWTFRTKSVVNSAPLISGSVLYVGSLDRNFYAIDIVSGRLLWSQPFQSRIKASPVVWHDFLVVLLEDGTIVCLKSQGEPLL